MESDESQSRFSIASIQSLIVSKQLINGSVCADQYNFSEDENRSASPGQSSYRDSDWDYWRDTKRFTDGYFVSDDDKEDDNRNVEKMKEYSTIDEEKSE